MSQSMASSYIAGQAMMYAAIAYLRMLHEDECIECFEKKNNERLDKRAYHFARIIVHLRYRRGLYNSENPVEMILMMSEDLGYEIDYQKIVARNRKTYFIDAEGRKWPTQ